MQKATITSIVEPNALPVSANELRKQLSMDTSEGDTSQLEMFIGAAWHAIERHIRQRIGAYTVTAEFLSDAGKADLAGICPVRGVTAANLGGNTVPTSDIRLSDSDYAPAAEYTGDAEGSECEVTLSAGFSPVPDALKIAILVLAADMFEHREAQNDGSLSENRTLAFIFDNFRLPGVY